MQSTATIAAVATASGPGAIGIVRVSGPRCVHIVTQVAERVPPPRHASLQQMFDREHRPLDRGLVLYFPGPSSYTGEDMLEFHTHGNALILDALVVAICAAGAVQAKPGEFTERAFLNGKIDLLQAEAVADLIASSTQQALRAASRALAGDFSRAIESIARALQDARAMLEASIDFSDEATVSQDLARPCSAVLELNRQISTLLANAQLGARLSHHPRVVIVGPPNAGKSTLLNALAGQDRAIVSPRPGTTRDVLTIDLVIDGISVTLADTAGLHVSTESIEQEGMRRAIAEIGTADLVLLVHAHADLPPSLAEWLDLEALRRDRLVYVRNKIDIEGEVPRLETVAGVPQVNLSARERSGLDLLREALRDRLGAVSEYESPMLARARHLDALRAAQELTAFTDVASFVRDPVETAERLRLAQHALGELTGEVTADDILGEIFSRFCIGK